MNTASTMLNTFITDLTFHSSEIGMPLADPPLELFGNKFLTHIK